MVKPNYWSADALEMIQSERDGYEDAESDAEDVIEPNPVDGILDLIKYYRQQVQLDTTLADKTTAEVLAELAQEIDIKFGD